MTEQENFDELIRQKFAEKEFVFNEENWEKAERKIDSTRRLNKIAKWSTIFIIGLFSGVFLTLLLVDKVNTNDTKAISELTNQTGRDNSSLGLNKENPNEEKNSSKLNSVKQNKNDVSKNEAEKENSTEIKNSGVSIEQTKTETNISNPELTKEKLSNTKRVSSNETEKAIISAKKKNNISNKESKLIALKTSPTKKEINKEELKEPKINDNKDSENNYINNSVENNSQKNSSTSSLTQITQADKTTNQSQNITLATTQPSETKSNSEVNSTEQSKTIATATIQQSETKSNSETNSAEQSKTIAADATHKNEATGNPEANTSAQPQTTVTTATQNDETKNNFETDSAKHQESQPLTKESVKQKLDSSDVSKQNNLIAPAPPALGGLASINIFSIDAGTNLEMGWKYADATEARGFNPVLGIGFTHYVNQKWSFHAGLQYGTIANLKVSQKAFSNTNYGFGSTSIDTVIDTKTLHYAIVPIMFEYHFSDKNSISIGGSISYLVKSKSNVTINTTNVTSIITDSNEVNSTSKSQTGYYANAFNKWDASLAIGYRRRLSKKFNVSAIANFGLLDVKNNEFFTRNTFERNIGLKIILSYNLFDF